MSTLLKKIQLKDLRTFCNSDLYNGFETKPISEERIKSYINNPNAKINDYVLYMILNGNQLIAYRTLLPDNYNKSEHFAWLSGNWVSPSFRRKGLSKRLFNDIYNDWNGKLMYSNYAPESHLLYQSTNKFNLLSSRDGYRYYLYSKPSQLLAERLPKWAIPFFKLIDFLVNIYATLKCKLVSHKTSKYTFSELSIPEKDFLEIFEKRQMNGFLRDAKSLKWILDYPWLTEEKTDTVYFFSHNVKKFFYRFISIKSGNDNIGFAILQFRDNKLKIPYCEFDKECSSEFGKFLINWIKSNKISEFTTWNNDVINAIDNVRKPFIFKKINSQKIFASWKIDNNDHLSSDGDGDYIFT